MENVMEIKVLTEMEEEERENDIKLFVWNQGIVRAI